MNIIMNSMMKRITVGGLLLATCTLYLAMQPLPASTANLSVTGTMTAWGYNAYGSVGDSSTVNRLSPVSVALPAGVTASAIATGAGSFHNLAITNDGVYIWGDGIITPTKVGFPPTVAIVTAIAAGASHNLALTNDGLYAWGGNSSGQLGDGTMIDRPTPVKVIFPATVTTITAVAAGTDHSFAITNDGLYAWGSNAGGQLGDGTRTNRSAPVNIHFPWLTTVRAVSGGAFHSLAVTDDGLFAWGNNTFGQLGDGSTRASLVPEPVNIPWPVIAVSGVAAGFWHSLFITNDGLYAAGFNGNGELGDGTTTARPAPVKSSFSNKVTTIMAVAAGDMHSLALTNDGLYAWGNNSSGQLGIGTLKSKLTPTKIKTEIDVISIGAGYYHSLALH